MKHNYVSLTLFLLLWFVAPTYAKDSGRCGELVNRMLSRPRITEVNTRYLVELQSRALTHLSHGIWDVPVEHFDGESRRIVNSQLHVMQATHPRTKEAVILVVSKKGVIRHFKMGSGMTAQYYCRGGE